MKIGRRQGLELGRCHNEQLYLYLYTGNQTAYRDHSWSKKSNDLCVIILF